MPFFGKKKTGEKKEESFQTHSSSSNSLTSIAGNNNGTVITKQTSTTHVHQSFTRTISTSEETTLTTLQRGPFNSIQSSLRTTRTTGAVLDSPRWSLPSSDLYQKPLNHFTSEIKPYQPVYMKNSSSQYVPAIASTSTPKKTDTDTKVVQQPYYATSGNVGFSTPSISGNANSTERKANLKVKVKKTGKKYDGETQGVPTYATSSKKHRKALIINNIKFMEDAKERQGAELDEKNLAALFKQMNFNVEVKRDVKKNDLLKAAKEFGNKSSWRPTGICVVVVMSHGTNLHGNTNILCTDTQLVPIDDIIQVFTGEKCTYLHGIPKIFIFQCCRGDQTDVLQTDASPYRRPRNYEDMLIAHATVPGYVAHRHPETGSWYIEKICEVFAERAHELDVESMLKIVDNELSKRGSVSRQTASYECRGFKRCYLHP